MWYDCAFMHEAIDRWSIGVSGSDDQDEKERIWNAGGPSGGVTEIDYTRPIDSIMGHFSSADDRLYPLPPRKTGSGALVTC